MQNNSFTRRRLSLTHEKINNNSNIDQSKMAQTVKLPALNAINKSVKYNDLSFTVSRDLNKLRMQPDTPNNIAQQSAHISLVTVRKRYDQLSKNKQIKQKQVHELENQRQKFIIQQNRFTDERANGQKKVKQMQQTLKNIKIFLQQSETQKKVMLNMISRIKFDKIVYDQRKYNLEKELNFIAKQKQIIIKQNSQTKQQDDRTRKVFNKLLQHLQNQQRQRQNHINSLMTSINMRQDVVQSSQNRKLQMKQIAQNTLSDKDSTQKKWYKVYLCHRFVEKMLRDKINRQMMKFNTVQIAFKNIKTATGVQSSQDLINKFLNKQRTYGEMLGKIADSQRQIQQLKKQNENMQKQRANLKSQKAMLSNQKTQFRDISKQQKQLLLVSEKASNCNLFYQQLKFWLSRNQKRFYHFDTTYDQTTKSINGQDVIGSFNTYLKRMLLNFEQINKLDYTQNEINSVFTNQNNYRINLSGEQQQKNDKRQNKSYQQQDYIDTQRQNLHRNNQKFMKQLKKKVEQTKAQVLAAQPKKKQISPQKPKIPIPQP